MKAIEEIEEAHFCLVALTELLTAADPASLAFTGNGLAGLNVMLQGAASALEAASDRLAAVNAAPPLSNKLGIVR